MIRYWMGYLKTVAKSNKENEVKKITHVFAVVLAGAVAFAASPAGQALVHQYPVISAVVGILGALAAVYHDPVTPKPSN